MKTLFTPGDDAITPVLQAVKAAKKAIRVCTFTFHIPALTDLLIAQHQAGVDVACLFDQGQASTFAPMVGEISRLHAAGVAFLTGTSPKHAYLHCKYVVADSMVLDGSFNMTAGSQNESNTLNVTRSAARAAQFTAAFASLWQWNAARQPVGAL